MKVNGYDMTEQELNDWFDCLGSTDVERICPNSLFDYESEETFDEEGNCNWDIFYAKSTEVWNRYTLTEKIEKYNLINNL